MNTNPGVKLLIRTQIDGKIFSIEERLGEGIFIYWGREAFNLSKENFGIFVKSVFEKKEMLYRDIKDFSISQKKILLDKILIGYNGSIDSIEDIKVFQKKMVMKYLTEDFPMILKNKSIVLKGAGEHTQKLIEIWKGKVNICGVWAKDLKKETGISTITEEELIKISNLVLIPSSFLYHAEMKYEIRLIEKKYIIFDIYDELEKRGIFVNSAFYQI